MKQIISASEASKILGVSSQCVRERLKRGIWGFGRAIPPDKNHKQWVYEIYTQQLMQYLKGSKNDAINFEGD